MLAGQDIGEAVKMFVGRSVRLHHACQFSDFVSYLAIGGIPSRAFLERHDTSFTPFDTDAVDRVNGVWDKVFFNLSDYGREFSRGKKAVPTAYGPILLVYKPSALSECNDVAICLRSAGAAGFDRSKEALAINDLDRLFVHRYGSTMKFKASLKSEFDSPTAQAPEVSCSVERGFVSFEHLLWVVADPYNFGQLSLKEHVSKAVNDASRNIKRVYERSCADPSRYDELAKLVRQGFSIADDAEKWTANTDIHDWLGAIRENGLGYQFERYASYLKSGTLSPLERVREPSGDE